MVDTSCEGTVNCQDASRAPYPSAYATKGPSAESEGLRALSKAQDQV